MTDFILSAFADEAADSLDGQIAALNRNNIKLIEIRNINGKSIIDYADNDLQDIRSQLDSAGIGISAIGSPIGKYPINEPLEPHMTKFERTIAAAKILGTKRIRMFSFFIPQGVNADSYHDEVIQRLAMLTDIAKANDVICCHENEKEIYGDIAARVLELHTHNADLGGIFDPANYIQCSQFPIEIAKKLKPYIDYIHIKDALIADGSVVPAGNGDGAIAEMLKIFHKPQAGCVLTVEPHLTVFNGLADLQCETLKHRYSYSSQDEAFDAAVTALKSILDREGYTYE